MFSKKLLIIFTVLSGLNSAVFGGDGDLGLPGMPESDPWHQAFLKELEAPMGSVYYLDLVGKLVPLTKRVTTSVAVPAVSLRDAVIPDQESKADLVSAPVVPPVMDAKSPVERRASPRLKKRVRDDQVVERGPESKDKANKNALLEEELRSKLFDRDRKCLVCKRENYDMHMYKIISHYGGISLAGGGLKSRCPEHAEALENLQKDEKYTVFFVKYNQQVLRYQANAKANAKAKKEEKRLKCQ